MNIVLEQTDTYHDFGEMLDFSRGVREQTDVATLLNMIPGAVEVKKTDEDKDRKGIDYIVTLRGGAEINIDGKARQPGTSQWWRNGPELALEKWSVLPGGKYQIPKERAKTGWTLNEASDSDMILFTFDESDTDECYLVGFQHLRKAFRVHITDWYAQYKVDTQDSKAWQSECVFVPAEEVLKAIKTVSYGTVVWEEGTK